MHQLAGAAPGRLAGEPEDGGVGLGAAHALGVHLEVERDAEAALHRYERQQEVEREPP